MVSPDQSASERSLPEPAGANGVPHPARIGQDTLPDLRKAPGFIHGDIRTYISLISMAVRQKWCTASYTLAKKAPKAPEFALVEGSEASNIDRFGSPPPPPLTSSLETLRADVRPWGGWFRVCHYP